MLARLTCQEERQDVNVMDTDVIRSMDEIEEQHRKLELEATAKKKRDKSSQRSQVALEVIKLRKELKRLKHIVQTKKGKKEHRDKESVTPAVAPSPTPSTSVSPQRSSSSNHNHSGHGENSSPTNGTQTAIQQNSGPAPGMSWAPHNATRVRFTEPLVTDVTYRPYTDPEDIEKLYFIEEELNELEWDRQTVADDQYEVVMTRPTANPKDVRIAHQKRRLLALHPQEGLPHSLSDLSVY